MTIPGKRRPRRQGKKLRNAPQPIVEQRKFLPPPLPGREGVLQSIIRDKTEYTRLFAEITNYTPKSKKAKKIMPALIELRTRILRATLLSIQMIEKSRRPKDENTKLKHARQVVEILRELADPRLVERKITKQIEHAAEATH